MNERHNILPSYHCYLYFYVCKPNQCHQSDHLLYYEIRKKMCFTDSIYPSSVQGRYKKGFSFYHCQTRREEGGKGNYMRSCQQGTNAAGGPSFPFTQTPVAADKYLENKREKRPMGPVDEDDFASL